MQAHADAGDVQSAARRHHAGQFRHRRLLALSDATTTQFRDRDAQVDRRVLALRAGQRSALERLRQAPLVTSAAPSTTRPRSKNCAANSRTTTPSSGPAEIASSTSPRRRRSSGRSSTCSTRPGSGRTITRPAGRGSSSRSRSAPISTRRARCKPKSSKVFDEKSVYRIDHYLGKEPVQDIMALRFANVIFEPIWNRRYVDSVQITAAETVGVEERGGYYDNAGALRDMIQNHVMNLLALVAMEPPVLADRRQHPRREVQGALGAAADGPQPDHARHRARPVRRRQHRRQAGAGLPRRTQRQPALEHRNVRGGQALHRQLALGRRAVLPAQRQTARAQELRDRDHASRAFRTASSAKPAIRSTTTCWS